MNLPKIKNTKDLIEENLKKREVVFEEDSSGAESPYKSKLRGKHNLNNPESDYGNYASGM